jgi:hypothetical protein
MLSEKEKVFWEYVMDHGFGSIKVQGLFSNGRGEGVWPYLDCWIKLGWLGLEGRGVREQAG